MAMRNVLIYGDIDSSDYGVYIGQKTIHNVPERAVEVVSVPGRNGALTIDKGHYENVPIEYYCFVDGETEAEMHDNYNAFKNAIASIVGYRKLVDTYYPDEYRMALFIEGIDAESVALGKGIEFILSFNCMPQRYLATGDTPVTVANNSVLNNPTLFDAEPLLMVNGYGNINFNSYNIELKNATIGRLTLINKGSGTLSFTSVDNGRIVKTFDNQLFNVADVIRGTMTVTVTCKDVDSMVDFAEVINDNENATYTTRAYTTRHEGSSSAGITINVGMIATITMPFSYGVRKDDTELTTSNYVTIRSTYPLSESVNELTFNMDVMYKQGNTIEYVVSYFDTDTFELSATVEYSDVVGDSTLLVLGNPTYIDCEVGEAYKYENGNLIGLNAYIDLGSDLPKLASGNNTFTIDNTITSLQVVPKWWQL